MASLILQESHVPRSTFDLIEVAGNEGLVSGCRVGHPFCLRFSNSQQSCVGFLQRIFGVCLLRSLENDVCFCPGHKDLGPRFGCARLDEVLEEAAPQGAEAVKSALLERFDEFLATRIYGEEVTFLVVEWEKQPAVIPSPHHLLVRMS